MNLRIETIWSYPKMAKIFRNYDTLSQFNTESIHPENKICFIKDKGVLYSMVYNIHLLKCI